MSSGMHFPLTTWVHQAIATTSGFAIARRNRKDFLERDRDLLPSNRWKHLQAFASPRIGDYRNLFLWDQPWKNRNVFREAAEYLPKGCSRKMPPFISSFWWGPLLEHSFLEHFRLAQFSVIQGNFYLHRFSNISFGRTLLGSNFGGHLLEQTFVGTVRPPEYHPGPNRDKFIPWNIYFCSNICNYYKNNSTRTFSFVMLLPLVCPCLQENMRRNLLCKEIVL